MQNIALTATLTLSVVFSTLSALAMDRPAESYEGFLSRGEREGLEQERRAKARRAAREDRAVRAVEARWAEEGGAAREDREARIAEDRAARADRAAAVARSHEITERRAAETNAAGAVARLEKAEMRREDRVAEIAAEARRAARAAREARIAAERVASLDSATARAPAMPPSYAAAIADLDGVLPPEYTPPQS